MNEFFSTANPHLYVAILLAVLNGVMMCFVSYKFMQIIQLSGYKLRGYFTWLKTDRGKYASRLVMLAFMSSACSLVANAIFKSFAWSEYYLYVGLIFYFYFTITFIRMMYFSPQKVPLKQTWRMNRFCVCLGVVAAGVSFLLLMFSQTLLPTFSYGILSLMPLLMIVIVPLVHLVVTPFEELNKKRFVFMAKAKLKKMPNLIKIGITGSYGKTSVKNILNVILSKKFHVCTSPHSFNTPMGLTKIVLEYLEPFHEVLIAEMGAIKNGEIAELCSIVNPQYGIISSIGLQHLETFKTAENIKQTKFELIKSLPQNGFAVFNLESDGGLCEKCTKTKFTVSQTNKNATLFIKNVVASKNGTSFVAVIENEEIPLSSSLLGKHNIHNIALAVCFAKQIGIETNQIISAVASLKPIPHRLEILNGTFNTIVIDDSYNSNPIGSKNALDVLSMFEEKEKVVITPGLVELGGEEKKENFEFGKNIAKSGATKVIVVNAANLDEIKSGLDAENFPPENIFAAETLAHAQVILATLKIKNGVILFENDLPDSYL